MRASLAERVGAVLRLHEHFGVDHLLEDVLDLGAGRELALAGEHLLLEGGDPGLPLRQRVVLSSQRLEGVVADGAELLHLGPRAPPLGADLEQVRRAALRGRDRVAGLDDGEHLGVDRDVEVAALGQPFVALEDLGLHEGGDVLADDGVAHVEEPLGRVDRRGQRCRRRRDGYLLGAVCSACPGRPAGSPRWRCSRRRSRAAA